MIGFAKILVAGAVIASIALFFGLGLYHEFTLAGIKERQEELQYYYQQHPAFTLLLFGSCYVALAALSLPGAAIMTLLAGALFGFLPALVLVSFASSIGATLAFLASRFVLRDWVQDKFGEKLSAVNEGIEREGAFYLFALRLTPFIPFLLVNLLTGLTPIGVGMFYLISQLGMLPGTALYVYAGRQLGRITSISGIFSPALIAAFIMLGLFPLAAKKVIAWWRGRKT
ncbi:MAG: TVP38/TMEM64 family protein [Pseudomonadota bacterium]|nr:TVP38/TMEM64 family protein [Pseudomonadota bacterium]